MKIEFSRQIFEKYSNIKFYENPSSGSRVIPCGRTDVSTDMTKLIVASRTRLKTTNLPFRFKKSQIGKLCTVIPGRINIFHVLETAIC